MKASRVLAGALAAAVMSTTLTPVVHAAQSDPRIEAYEKQLQSMQRQMDELRARLKALEEERAAAPAAATATPPAQAPAVAEQDRKIGVIATEVERLKSSLTLPEAKEYKSAYGLGPAASKVYQLDRGLSIGGYGEFHYSKPVSDQRGEHDQFDLERFVLYAGYKFNDWILLNSEIEFENALIGEDTVAAESGAVEVEFAYLDFLLWQQLNVRAGLVLVPMGFLNEMHEPPFYFGNARPEVESRLLPTTWREGGIGIFGELAPGLTYRGYVLNGLNARGFSAEESIREGRGQGNRAFADDLAGTLRIDYANGGALVGVSGWAGASGQNQDFDGSKPNAFTLVGDAHAQFQYHGLWLRALGVLTHIDDAAVISRALGETIGSNQFGAYGEIAYDVLPLVVPETTQYLAPFFRYEIFDTQDDVPRGFARDPGHDVKLYTVGFSYKPHPQVVLKLDYRNFNNGKTNPLADEFSIGAGFIF
jgi:hypothetical protein